MKFFLCVVAALLFFPNILTAAIPASERTALIALYTQTNGDAWTDKSGWKTPPLHTDGFAMPGTEGIWAGVTVHSDHVTEISLSFNKLSGTIPGEIGGLQNLQGLYLDYNQLSDTIPSQLENLTRLTWLNLNRNGLKGEIPVSITSLVNLIPRYTDIGYNGLYSNDSSVISFLNSKNPPWASPQTIAPDNVSASPTGSTSIQLTWDAIPFTAYSGGYLIYFAISSGGPFVFYGEASGKTATSMSVTGAEIAGNTTIALTAGWNWVAFFPSYPLATSNALASINGLAEQVKSQVQSAIYANGQWLGDLEQMAPGEGYMIRMNSPGILAYLR